MLFCPTKAGVTMLNTALFLVPLLIAVTRERNRVPEFSVNFCMWDRADSHAHFP